MFDAIDQSIGLLDRTLFLILCTNFFGLFNLQLCLKAINKSFLRFTILFALANAIEKVVHEPRKYKSTLYERHRSEFRLQQFNSNRVDWMLKINHQAHKNKTKQKNHNLAHCCALLKSHKQEQHVKPRWLLLNSCLMRLTINKKDPKSAWKDLLTVEPFHKLHVVVKWARK